MSELAAALAAFQADLPKVGKNASAQYGRYADLADVTEAILPALNRAGLIWTCAPTMQDGQFGLRYLLAHVTSEDERQVVTGFYPLGAVGNAQAMGSAITYARRYCLLAVTGVAPDEDDDGQEATNAQAGGVRGPGEGSPLPASGGAGGTARGTAAGTAGRPGDGGNPAGSLAPEERPGSIDGRQRTRLQICMRDMGIMDRDARLAEWSEVVGRPIASGDDLSFTEGDALLRIYEPLAKIERAKAGRL
jgi:hypothetical protein